MNTVKFAIAASALALLAAPAHAEYYNPMTWNGGYVSAKGGWNSIENDRGVNFDDGYSLDAAVGARVAPQLRTEFEVGFQDADIKGSGDIGSLTLMANGYYDFNNLGSWSTVFTPFVGLGLGAAHHEISLVGGGATDWGFAYAAAAGASYQLCPNFAITAEYKYLGTESIDTPGANVDYNSHNFLAGLRYSY